MSRNCGHCDRVFDDHKPLEVEDLGIVGIRKRFKCPFCGWEMNYFDQSTESLAYKEYQSVQEARAKSVIAVDVQAMKTNGDIDGLVALFGSPKAWEAVQALVTIGSSAVPRLLNTLLVFRSDDACWRAAQALSDIGATSIPAAHVIGGLKSAEASVRRWSAWVLQKIGSGITDSHLRSLASASLFACLADPSPDVRRYAADALSSVVDESDRAQLIKHLGHEDRLVREGIASALDRIGDA